MRLVACIQYAGQTAEREEHDHPNPASKPGSRNSAELTLRLRRSHVLYVTRCREMDDFAQTVGWPQGHATLHSMVASKRSDDALHDGDEMQLTSSGFSLSQVLSGERVRMRMIQHTRARAGRRVLSSTRGDEVCSRCVRFWMRPASPSVQSSIQRERRT
jgi:hypothetical protein